MWLILQLLVAAGHQYTEATDLASNAVPAAVTTALCNSLFIDAHGDKIVRCGRIRAFCFPPQQQQQQPIAPPVVPAANNNNNDADRPVQLKDCTFKTDYKSLDSVDLYDKLEAELNDHLD